MAGIDILNQFPNSRMARAVKVGQSRFMSVDAPNNPAGSQNNIGIAAPTALTVPTTTGDGVPVTYAVITAVNGPLYATYDGSTPSSANYAITLAQGASMPIGGAALNTIKVVGTQMSVSYSR